jgi:hypothetical protein
MGSSEANAQLLSLKELALRCAQQTARFFQRVESDTRFCFEIFRRAVVEKDEQAWAFLHEIYQGQLERWVRRHPSYAACREDESYLASRALEKFWQAVAPAHFSRFPDLNHILRYLQMCVNSAIGEHIRANQRARYEVDLEEAEQRAGGEAVEAGILARSQGSAFWRMIVERLNDPKEVQVAYDSFLLDLKPGEIIERHPGQFESTREIYRIKENILSRLRRDSALQNFAGLKPETRA